MALPTIATESTPNSARHRGLRPLKLPWENKDARESRTFDHPKGNDKDNSKKGKGKGQLDSGGQDWTLEAEHPRPFDANRSSASRASSPDSKISREYCNNSTRWLGEPLPVDAMTSRMCDTVAAVMRQECNCALQGYIREGFALLEKQQATFMKSVAEQIGALAEAAEQKPSTGDKGQVYQQGDALPRQPTKAVSFVLGEDTTVAIDKSNQRGQKLLVTVLGCDDLLWERETGTCDPYCMCTISNRTVSAPTLVKTPTLKDTLGPKWNYTDTLTDYEPGDSLTFEVRGGAHNEEEDGEEDVFLGHARLDCSLLGEGGVFEGQLPLEDAGLGPKPCLHVAVQVANSLVEETERPSQEPSYLRTPLQNLRPITPSSGLRAITASPDEEAEELMKEIMAEEDHRMKIELLSRIPYPCVRDPAIRCVQFFALLREPERVGKITNFEASSSFFILSMLFVCADQMVTVAATNHLASTLAPDELPAMYSILEGVFLAWFALELGIKLFVHRFFFFMGNHRYMNLLDFFLVVYSSIEALGLDLSFLRALRVFKMAKVIRMLKALSSVRDLRVMIDCLITSWFAMFWAIVLISFLTYMFALVFVQALCEYMIEERSKNTLDPELHASVMERFGTVQLGILSLFMSLTGGFDWGEMYDLIVAGGPVGTIACLFFVTFFTISVWNIVSSIFVEKVMDTAKPSSQESLLKDRSKGKVDAAELKGFFAATDTNHNGSMEEGEWINLVEDSDLSDFMVARDLTIKDTVDVTAFYDMAYEDCLRHSASKLNDS